MPGLEPERVDEEVDLLLGALGERVAQVGRAEVVGERLEPVVGLGVTRTPGSRLGTPTRAGRTASACRPVAAVVGGRARHDDATYEHEQSTTTSDAQNQMRAAPDVESGLWHPAIRVA